MTYRKFEIKKRNGSTRAIYAPDSELLAYQQERLPELTTIFHKVARRANVDDLFHGFVPARNVVTAAEMHIGFNVTLSMDIVSCFDSVTPSHVPFLINTDYLFADGKAAQGFATSPMIANIALIHPLKLIKEELDNIIKPGEYAITIYADDITVSLNYEKVEAVMAIAHRIEHILNKFKFQINPNKTHIRWAKYGFRRVLGVNVGDNEVRATRKIMRRIRSAKHLARHAKDPDVKQHAIFSSGGLTTWSRCLRPKAARQPNAPRFVHIAAYQEAPNTPYPGNCQA